MSKLAAFTEVFYSIQGEGARTGRLTTWVRFFSCNLNCDGFGQVDPTDQSTYVLPYQTIDAKSIKNYNDVPLFHTGCDTSHSWSAKFKHLAQRKTPREVADLVRNTIPGRSFCHIKSGQRIEHVFTGGEPLIQQEALVGIVDAWIEDGDYPRVITIETNGTKKLTDEFMIAVKRWNVDHDIHLYFSVSQKLFNVSGELPEKAFVPEVIQQYSDLSLFTSGYGQLKFVVNDNDDAWHELLSNVEVLRRLGVLWEVWIMPVGASYEAQTESSSLGKITDRALQEGFNVTGRLHVILFGNEDQAGR